MRVLLGSGGFRTPERVATLTDQMRSFFGSIRRLLFVPYAVGSHDAYVEEMARRGLNASYNLDGLHLHPDPAAAVRRAEGIFVGGGNTFRLLDALYRHGLVEPIRQRVHEGMPYLGVSAGCNVACPTIKTTNDMPIVQPPSFTGLALVPFQVNPHYYEGQSFFRGGEAYVPHFGETRDERIAEFHQLNDAPVVGLWEGGVLCIEFGAVELIGAPARVFRKGREPVDVRPGGDVGALLRG
jgi:dipeptidase E